MFANDPVQFHIKQLYLIRKLPFCCGGSVELHSSITESKWIFLVVQVKASFRDIQTREMPSDVAKRAKN